MLLCINTTAQVRSSSSLTIETSPGTVIWVDAIRYGAVPDTGELTVKNLRDGNRIVRARFKGKREITKTVNLVAGSEQSVQLTFSAPADKAELSFQNAEGLREKGKHAEAIKEYRNAIKLRPGGYPSARTGLARSLAASDKQDAAVAEARRAISEKNGTNPEAYTIIANIRRSRGFSDEAIAGYKTALNQARNFSPEAHTGLAITYQDRNLPGEAIKHFQTAIAQANETEPMLYFLIGTALEREYRNKEAVEAYEKYLRLDPTGSQASATRSIIRLLRREIR